MKFSAAATILAVISTTTTALAARLPLPIKTSSGPVKPNSYIVVLKPGTNMEAHIKELTELATRSPGSELSITHQYDERVLHAYSVQAIGPPLNRILISPDVDYVEADGIASIKYDVHEENEVEREDAPSELTDGLAEFGGRAAGGAGVVVYGIDTGIYTAHSCFGGRASWGATFGGYASRDGNGHGTHTAGTAVGTTYGVATSARIVAIKVLSDQGSGSYSDIISGVNFAYNQFRTTRAPSIATMSLGGPLSTALNSAVNNAIAGGLHFTIAAGNSAVDARNTSPASVIEANTIGAIDGSTNRIASFSNYGSIIDVFAPGVNILSAWIGSTTATARLSGTSMATPYVAGVLALALSEYGQVSPAGLSNALKTHARPVVTGQPAGTTNLRAYFW
ncbi:peptidase S8/S53 domain-containing protein [Cantharellus anzutake]|uniref:peptidase S8/S53 domain-containing protein n=1 Tax=Cantharellus anzutake TaxID=1750568 RepID=UPI001907E2DB|nr:peptidase S8/S53 domain-containing protein [Cantharellus anzutake]KAF8318562.1 peptidase S8/S53 domain-containing protein [Cantharellus anzutake]